MPGDDRRGHRAVLRSDLWRAAPKLPAAAQAPQSPRWHFQPGTWQRGERPQTDPCFHAPGARERNRSPPLLNSIWNLLNCCLPYQRESRFAPLSKTGRGTFSSRKHNSWAHTVQVLHHYSIIYKTDREPGAVKITPS